MRGNAEAPEERAKRHKETLEDVIESLRVCGYISEGTEEGAKRDLATALEECKARLARTQQEPEIPPPF